MLEGVVEREVAVQVAQAVVVDREQVSTASRISSIPVVALAACVCGPPLEGHGDDADGEDAELARHRGDDGSRTGPECRRPCRR